jgi:hypothetical protein
MSIKQNGGVFGRNPTFNDVTIEGQLTFDGDIDINSDLKVDGNIETTGNLVIGTSGKGIDFSATAGTGTSELLDDYEEGTFTPTISDAASGGNMGSASTASGHYTKVGRVVTIAIDLINIVTTGLTSGNYIYIGGLPFTSFSGAGSPAFTGSVLGASSWSGITTGIVSNIGESHVFARFVRDTDPPSGNYLTVGDVNSGASDARFSTSYFAV